MDEDNENPNPSSDAAEEDEFSALDLEGGDDLLGGLDIDLNAISTEDLQYLLSRYQFLQILNSEATFENFEGVKILDAITEWKIHDLGDALSSSPGSMLFGGLDASVPLVSSSEGDDGEGGGRKPGKGTIIKQAFDTAAEMVRMAKDRWPGVQIVDGSELMKWTAWLTAEELGLKIYGFEASVEAKKKRERLRKYKNILANAVSPGIKKSK